MTKKSNARQVPFAGTDQMRVLAKFKPDECFVIHTLTRVCAEVLKVGYPEAEKFAHGLIDAGLVVPASKIGLTEMQTFKLSDQ
jgi:hypothetical protein